MHLFFFIFISSLYPNVPLLFLRSSHTDYFSSTYFIVSVSYQLERFNCIEIFSSILYICNCVIPNIQRSHFIADVYSLFNKR